MLNSLPVHFAEGNALSEKEIEESKVLISKIDGKGLAEDGVITRLCELAVSWVILNPNPLPLRRKHIADKTIGDFMVKIKDIRRF